jgi:hypothetical protein
MARSEWKESTELIEAALRILKEIAPATVRQTFYQLVVVELITNCDAAYRRVSRLLTIARRDGRIPFEMIVDRSRQTHDHAGWDDLEHLAYNMDLMLKEYRRDYWQDQPIHTEVILEKDAMSGSIMPVVKDYGLMLHPVRGFDSTANVHLIAKRLVGRRRAGKRVHILYLGDFDASGTDMDRDVKARLEEYMNLVQRDEGKPPNQDLCQVELERVAIFQGDIDRYRLPPQKVKSSDPRAKAFVRRHGRRTVELDALNPDVLRRRLRSAIERHIERQRWERARMVEEAQRNTCQRYAGMLNKMAKAGQ